MGSRTWKKVSGRKLAFHDKEMSGSEAYERTNSIKESRERQTEPTETG